MTVMESIALLNGMDGTTLSTVVGAIGTIVGAAIGVTYVKATQKEL
jgi:hypothetical protein